MERSRTLCIYIEGLTLEEKKELVVKATKEKCNSGLDYFISNDCSYLHYSHPTNPEIAEEFHKQAIKYVNAVKARR